MNNDGATRNMTENPVIVVVGDDYDLSSGVFASSNDTMYRIKDYDLKATCETYGWDYNSLEIQKSMHMKAIELGLIKCGVWR